jgi:hypothetical protein
MADELGNVRSSDILGTETAPLIYFDGVTAFGVSMGTIQIELAANAILPRKGAGPPRSSRPPPVFDAIQTLPPISDGPSKKLWKWPRIRLLRLPQSLRGV